MCDDDGQNTTVTDVVTLEYPGLQTLGAVFKRWYPDLEVRGAD
jgi:hypothetical protein